MADDYPLMKIVRVFDPNRQPPNWTDIIRPGQFVAFSKHIDSGAPCDTGGVPFELAESVACIIFDNLAEAEAFCTERVLRVPTLRFDVFESTGRTQPPLLTVVHPSRIATLDGNPRSARINKWASIVLVIAAPILFWIDWWKYDGLLILPTILGINMLIIAARLIQLNGAHASAERARRERLQKWGHSPLR
jgi:hypothetical protein